MLATVKDAFRWVHDEPRHRTGVRLLQIATGLLLLFRMASEGRYAPYFWGPHGVGQGSIAAILGPRLGTFLNHVFDTDAGTYAVVAGTAVSAMLLVMGTSTRLATAGALLCSLLLEHRLPELLDGGDNITRLVLIYMLFLVPAKKTVARGSLAAWVHNVAVLAIMIQVCILYVTAGFMKAQGPKWFSGTALYVVSQVEWFSLPSTRWMFKNALIVTVASYATIFFQVWFPIAIFSRLRYVWVALGILLHVGIAHTMGLIPFSTVMIGIELFMLSDDDYVKLAARVADLRATLAPYVARVAGRFAPKLAPVPEAAPLAQPIDEGTGRD